MSYSYRALVVHLTIFLNTLNEKGKLESNILKEPRMIDPEAYFSFSSGAHHSLIKPSTNQTILIEIYFIPRRCKTMLRPQSCELR